MQPLLSLSNCGETGLECGSLDTRNSVVKIISDDKNNALVNFAVKNSSSVAAMLGDKKSDAEKLAIWERAKQGAVYTLDDTVLTNSRDRIRRAVTCSGLLYVKVGDTIAQWNIRWSRRRMGRCSFQSIRFCFDVLRF
jgi:hypothetical protein